MQSVYIWGLGAFYKRNVKKLEKYNILGYIDNNPDKNGTLYKGKKVISSKQATVDMPILIMSKEFIPMAYELIDRGIKHVLIGTYLFPESYQEQLLRDSGRFKIEESRLLYNDNVIQVDSDIKKIYRKLVKNSGVTDFIEKLPEIPMCRDFGITRGTPIDRKYIEQFLEKYREDIKGEVLEIADNTYTLKYGEDRIKKSYILHVKGWGDGVICGNLATGDGIDNNRYDSAIVTQTLMFIYDLKKVVFNIHRMLKPGGVALVTVAGISQISRYDAENWGSYWGFQRDSLKKLFEEYFKEQNITIESYGNVKTATAMLYGMCAEEISIEAFKYNDLQYPVILGIRIEKEMICQQEND